METSFIVWIWLQNLPFISLIFIWHQSFWWFF